MKIDRELHDLIPPQSPDERKRMIESVLKDGWQESVTIWTACDANGNADTLLDGHSRDEAWNSELKDKGVPYPPMKVVKLDSRKDARDWIRRKSFSRRNMSHEVKTRILGEWYLEEQNEHGGDRKSSVQNDHLKSDPENKGSAPASSNNTAEWIAEQAGVSPSTVRRAARKVKSEDEARANPKPKKKPEPDKPKDPAGVDIEAGHETVFVVEPVFKNAMALITEAKNKVLGQCGVNEGARLVDVTVIENIAADFRRIIKECTPQTRCPHCKPGKGDKKCTRCKGRSWICWSEFRTLGGPEKEILGLK